MDEQRDDAEERLPRRDQAFPAAWVHETSHADRLDGFVGTPQRARPVSIGRLIAVALISFWLIVVLVASIARLVFIGFDPGDTLGFLFLGIFEVAGWWFVVHVIRRR